MLYDAWGNVTYDYNEELDSLGMLEAMNIASINSIAYRGYFYDYETGLYYLQSRYYDPETGRFINADDTAYIGYDSSPISTNIFAYCANNPVNSNDVRGDSRPYISGYSYGCGYTGNYVALRTKDTYQLNAYIGQKYVYANFKKGIIFIWSNQGKDLDKVLKNGNSKTLACVLYKLSCIIDKRSLKGRTINGLAFEIVCHYIIFLALKDKKICQAKEKSTIIQQK